jgi:hypothetical protein
VHDDLAELVERVHQLSTEQLQAVSDYVDWQLSRSEALS